MTILSNFACHCSIRPSAIVSMVLVLMVAPVSAQWWNTGVVENSGNTPLPEGAVDPKWRVIAGPGFSDPFGASAFVVNNQHPLGSYFETADSRWIWVNREGGIADGGPYTFRTFLVNLPLDSLDYSGRPIFPDGRPAAPGAFRMAGFWGADDTNGQITLNGAAPLGTGLTLSGTSATHYNEMHPFTITGGFIPDDNYLDVTVTDIAAPLTFPRSRWFRSPRPMR